MRCPPLPRAGTEASADPTLPGCEPALRPVLALKSERWAGPESRPGALLCYGRVNALPRRRPVAMELAQPPSSNSQTGSEVRPRGPPLPCPIERGRRPPCPSLAGLPSAPRPRPPGGGRGRPARRLTAGRGPAFLGKRQSCPSAGGEVLIPQCSPLGTRTAEVRKVRTVGVVVPAPSPAASSPPFSGPLPVRPRSCSRRHSPRALAPRTRDRPDRKVRTVFDPCRAIKGVVSKPHSRATSALGTRLHPMDAGP